MWMNLLLLNLFQEVDNMKIFLFILWLVIISSGEIISALLSNSLSSSWQYNLGFFFGTFSFIVFRLFLEK